MANQIYELLPKVMADIGPILKDRKNTGPRGYMFRGVDQVLSRVQPVIIKHGVTLGIKSENHVVTQRETDKGIVYHATLLLTVTFCAPDGSSVASCVPGEARDTNDDKATFKAMSMAFKYALFFGLCIPVEKGVIAEGDRGKPKAEAQRDKFADISTAIEKENAPEKLRRFKTRIEELSVSGELSVDQAAAALSQLNGKLQPA
jgi:hypothetical protein